MPIFARDNNKVVFLFESGTYSQPSGTSGNWLGLVTAHTLTENENVMEIRYAGTSNRNFGQLVAGPQDFEGKISYHPQDFRMLMFALGSCVDTSGAQSATHRVSEINSDSLYYAISGTNQYVTFPSFTIKDSKRGISDGNHYVRTVNGCVVDSLSITASQGEAVKCELSYKGQAFTLGSKTTDIVNTRDEDTSRPFVWSDATFYLPSGTIVEPVNEITYTIENNIETRHYVNGSRVAQAFVPTMRNHTLDLKLDVTSTWFKTLSDYHKNGSVFNSLLEFEITGSENGFFVFSGCKITELETPSEVEGLDETTVKIRPQSVSFVGSDFQYRYNPY